MAEIVLGMWLSHGPTLSTKPENWTDRIAADKTNKRLFFRGQPYDFDTLTALREAEALAEKCSLEERRKRHAACQVAIDALADKLAEVDPDVVVIMGNDQHELFLDDVMPAVTVYRGATFYNEPKSEEQIAKLPPGIHESAWACEPERYTEYPGAPDLAEKVIQDLVAAEFDVAVSSQLPRREAHKSSGIPHAFGFVLRRIMRDKPYPTLPIIFNTFFPPNQPTAKRCYNVGEVVGRTIRSWDSDLRVAVLGSGGMSHFVIDEDFDERFFTAFEARDAAALTDIDENYFQSGTSELKNWIAAAGALFGTDLRPDYREYQPCYRSEAGTGTANGFVYWS